MKFIPSLTLFALILATTLGTAWSKTVVYISESKDQVIGIYSIDESSGELTRLGEVQAGGACGSLATSADGKYLYSSVRSAKSFGTHSIDPKTGMLTKINLAPTVGGAAYIYPDKTGKWLLAAYYGEGMVSVSKIVDGVIRGEAVSSMEVGERAHCIQIDPANRFVFTPHTMPLNKVDQFVFDADKGELKLNATSPAFQAPENAGPRHLQIHPNGKWIYVVNEQGKSVSLCDYDADKGVMTHRKTLSTHPEGWDEKGSCADIEISADGKFVYASNRGHNSIAVFQIDPKNGELTALGQTPTEDTPRSFNLIPGGENFVVAAGQRSNTLIVYRRDTKTGMLTPLKTYDCGQSPAWVLGVKLK